jgi:replicative DNA helicase
MRSQLELEEQFIAGVLQSTDNLTALFVRSSDDFLSYLTARELKFIFSLILTTYQSYSSLLTEQILVSALTERGASEEDILKYKYQYKKLKKIVINETDFKFVVDKLIDNYISRSLIDSFLQSQTLLEKEKNGQMAFDLLEKNLMLLKAQTANKNIREISTRDLMGEVRLYEDIKAHPEKYRGIKIGIDKLDAITGGFRKGELVITMGATKVGKSIFLLNTQYNTMIQGLNSIYVTIEMPAEQVRRRLASRISGIPYLGIRNTNLTDNELEKLKTDLTAFETNHGFSQIIDVPKDCTTKLIEAKIQSLRRTQKIDLIIIDYLLLMTPSVPHTRMSREERVTQISLELKEMARALDIPVITATQVNAAAEEGKKKKINKPYEWYDAGQAKSVAANSDWLLSLKREPDVNILNLGMVVGRDGDLDEVIPLVVDFKKMLIGNFEDISTTQEPSQQPTSADNF